MRKFVLALLSIISTVCLAVSLPLFSVHAQNEQSSVSLETFLPSSAMQLYKLESPLNVSYSNSGFLVITEHRDDFDNGLSLDDRISVYNPNTKSFTAILPENNETVKNVTHAQVYNGNLYYLSSSVLYSLPIDNLNSTPTETGVTSSNFFMISNGFIITNTNNSIVFYRINENQNTVTFEKQKTLNFTTKNAFISTSGNVYYLFGGKLFCYKTTDSSTVLVSNIPFDVNYMAECGDFIFLTSINGLYKVSKAENSTPELVVPVTENANSLGYLKNPQGITVMGNDLLIADTDLKCVQSISSITGEFNDFAITTESTADYRLTNNATKITVSENYAYVLDDGEIDKQNVSYKRIVRSALDKNVEKRYLSISLKPLYEQNPNFKVDYLACSDTHIAIYANKVLNIYEVSQAGELSLVYTVHSESVTSLSYLDGEFYYTDYGLKDFEYNVVNFNKITMPSIENGLTSITQTLLNETVKIQGIANNACVDVFGNAYVLIDVGDGGSGLKLVRYSDGTVSEITTITHPVISMHSDFGGNVYMLSSNNVLYKYSGYSSGNLLVETFILSTDKAVKDIYLSYRTPLCYALIDACIMVTDDNDLKIENLSAVSSAGLDLKGITNNKFIKIRSDAKLFKINLGNYDSNGNFNLITPIPNPNPNKVYLVVSELDNYYVVSYSDKLVALINKNSFGCTVIEQPDYTAQNIYEQNSNNEKYYLTNDTVTFAKPIFDTNYKTEELSKGSEVYALKTVKFNGTDFTLVSKTTNGQPIGYVVSGYLTEKMTTAPTFTQSNTMVVDGNGNRHFNDVLMVLIISLTVTLTALFIEKKLLFDKEDGNVEQ